MLTHLRYVLSEFISNETTLVRHQAAIPMALVVGMMVGLAVFSGAWNAAAADTCRTSPGTACRDPIYAFTCYELYACHDGRCDGNQCVCSACCPRIPMKPRDGATCESACAREWHCPVSWYLDDRRPGETTSRTQPRRCRIGVHGSRSGRFDCWD